jgi:hypothetical protein
MKAVHAARDISEKNYRTKEEFLDLLIWTFAIANDAGMVPIVLYQNNLRPMYEKWPHVEQARWLNSAKQLNILKQLVEFRKYIRARSLPRWSARLQSSPTAGAAASEAKTPSPRDPGQAPASQQKLQKVKVNAVSH